MIEGDLTLIPYVQYRGGWSLSDQQIQDIFTKMAKQGLATKVFYGEEINTSYEFMLMAKQSGNVMSTIWVGDVCVSVAWLNQFGPNYASAHFCHFKEVWGHRTLECGEMFMGYWFDMEDGDDSPLFDVLLGQIAATNTRAVEYTRRLGWTVLGTIPRMGHGKDINKRCGDTIVYIEREAYHGKA